MDFRIVMEGWTTHIWFVNLHKKMDLQLYWEYGIRYKHQIFVCIQIQNGRQAGPIYMPTKVEKGAFFEKQMRAQLDHISLS